MRPILCKEPFEYIIIDNTYNSKELELIFLELDFWAKSGKLLGPNRTGSGMHQDGSLKKKNTGIFLDEAYTDRNSSNILSLNRKIYHVELDSPSIILNYLRSTDRDSTLISYYENTDKYDAHSDLSILTSLTYLYHEPKAFQGGELILSDYGLVFEPVFNRTYIIPSVVNHEVTPITMHESDYFKGLGRYCISNFMQCFTNIENYQHSKLPE